MTNTYQPNFQIRHDTAGIASGIGDDLSDEELQQLLRACGAKVAPARKPQPKNFVDLDKILGGPDE